MLIPFSVLLMDISQAAFGLDMRSASRIFFINPVLNPQVEAQAIGRARRISQKKPVTVETLVLRGSIEEVIVRRRGEMTQAEQRRCKSILDDKPIYEWMLNAQILPLSEKEASTGPSQMAPLQEPLLVFGRGFGRAVAHPDQDLVTADEATAGGEKIAAASPASHTGRKRPYPFASRSGSTTRASTPLTPQSAVDEAPRPKIRKVMFAGVDGDED